MEGSSSDDEHWFSGESKSMVCDAFVFFVYKIVFKNLQKYNDFLYLVLFDFCLTMCLCNIISSFYL